MRKLEDLEAEIIRLAISRYEGRMSEIARRLGIGRSTLYRKLKDLGLEDGAETPPDEELAEIPLAANG
jgi:DNA-binding NtrC family response regulator